MAEATIAHLGVLRSQGETRPAVIVDFGLGDGRMLDELAKALRQQLPELGYSMADVRLIGVGHITSPTWLGLDESIEIVWGQADYLFDHLGESRVDLLISNKGFYYFPPEETINVLEKLIDHHLEMRGEVIFDAHAFGEISLFLDERSEVKYRRYDSFDFERNQTSGDNDVFQIVRSEAMVSDQMKKDSLDIKAAIIEFPADALPPYDQGHEAMKRFSLANQYWMAQKIIRKLYGEEGLGHINDRYDFTISQDNVLDPYRLFTVRFFNIFSKLWKFNRVK